jgi:hypothetical protein
LIVADGETFLSFLAEEIVMSGWVRVWLRSSLIHGLMWTVTLDPQASIGGHLDEHFRCRKKDRS